MSETEDLSAYYFDESDELLDGGAVHVAPITADYITNPPSVIDRFFTRYYYKKSGVSNDLTEYYLVLFHSNRVCLICLAPEHPAFKIGIEKISFDFGGVDRSQNKVRGKGKKGGMILQEDSTLALITCKNGVAFKVPSCIKGKLIEINERVLKNPDILRKEGDGYLAIVLPKIERCEEIKESLLSQECYSELIKNE